MNMTRMAQLGAVMVLVMGLAGCYVESMEERPPAAPGLKLDEHGDPIKPGECRMHGLARGCLDGYIVVNDITVGGEEFHNADVLAASFHDLIAVERKADGEPLIEGENFALQLKTPLTNRNFAEGFNFYVSGDTLLDGTVRKNHFAVNGLREGFYDIRIEKQLKFAVSYQQIGVDQDGNEVEEDIERVYCASIFADNSFEVLRGQRTRMSFKEYEIHISNDVCEKDAASDVILIP